MCPYGVGRSSITRGRALSLEVGGEGGARDMFS